MEDENVNERRLKIDRISENLFILCFSLLLV